MGNQFKSPGASSLVPAAMLGLLGVRGAMTRAELAASLHVSSATITSVSKQLIARNMVTELDEIYGEGRPARPLALNGNNGRIAGLKIAPSHVTMVISGLDGKVFTQNTEPFHVAEDGGIDEMTRIVQRFVDKEPSLLGLGVGIPGAVDSPERGVVNAPSIQLRNARIGETLQQRLGMPVFVENDVNALAIAEQVYGAGRSCSTYMVLTIGRGIGCGLVINDEMHRGANGDAGEIGHFPMQPNSDRICPDGHRGCLDSLIGSSGLLARARELGLSQGAVSEAPIDEQMEAIDEYAQRARNGNARIRADLFEWAGDLLGKAVAGAVNLFDPETLVLLGEGMPQWDLWEPGFERALRSGLMESRRSVPYLAGSWDESRWALGAAALVISSLFNRSDSGRMSKAVRSRLSQIALGKYA